MQHLRRKSLHRFEIQIFFNARSGNNPDGVYIVSDSFEGFMGLFTWILLRAARTSSGQPCVNHHHRGLGSRNALFIFAKHFSRRGAWERRRDPSLSILVYKTCSPWKRERETKKGQDKRKLVRHTSLKVERALSARHFRLPRGVISHSSLSIYSVRTGVREEDFQGSQKSKANFVLREQESL